MDRYLERYDTGTRIWTTIFGVLVAGVTDWLAVVNPASGRVAEDPHTGWWLAALVFVCVAPACWMGGRLAARNYPQTFVWLVVLIAIVNAQFFTLTWANSQ